MLEIAAPKLNQAVSPQTPFAVAGFATPNFIKEVTIQVDNGPIMQAFITIVPMPRGVPPLAHYIGSGEVAAQSLSGSEHVVVVKSFYWQGEGETAKTSVVVVNA